MGKRSVEPKVDPESTVKKEKFENNFEEMSWSKLLVKKTELNLQIVLKCGQSFRWSQFRSSPPQWIGVLHGKLFVLSQGDDEVLYKVLPENADKAGTEDLLTDYFQLKVRPTGFLQMYMGAFGLHLKLQI